MSEPQQGRPNRARANVNGKTRGRMSWVPFFVFSLVAMAGVSVSFAQLSEEPEPAAEESAQPAAEAEPAADASQGGGEPAFQPVGQPSAGEGGGAYAATIAEADGLLASADRAIANTRGTIQEMRRQRTKEAEVVECLMGVLTRGDSSSPGMQSLRTQIEGTVTRMRASASQGDGAAVSSYQADLFGNDGAGGSEDKLRRLEEEAAACISRNVDPEDDLAYLKTEEAEDVQRAFELYDAQQPIGTPVGTGAIGADPTNGDLSIFQVTPPVPEGFSPL